MADDRQKEQPNPAVDKQAYNNWYRENDGFFFHGRFYRYVAAIHKELTDLHIDDPELDELLQTHERYFQDRQQHVQDAIDHPSMYHLNLRDIREIGERLEYIATQVPQR